MRFEVETFSSNNISHHFNVVFVFCIAILLATAVKASPIESEDHNDIVVEAENEKVFEPIQMFRVDEKSSENKIEPADVQSNEAAEMINEPSGDEVAVPYEDKNLESEGEVFQIDEAFEVKLTAEEKERILGIGIPLCLQYGDDRNPLHLR